MDFKKAFDCIDWKIQKLVKIRELFGQFTAR